MAENKWVTGVKTLLSMGVMDGYGTKILLMVQKSQTTRDGAKTLKLIGYLPYHLV